MTAPSDDLASVRYIVDDVAAAIDFYSTHLGFTVLTDPAPAFADMVRGPAGTDLRRRPGDGTMRRASPVVPGEALRTNTRPRASQYGQVRAAGPPGPPTR